MQRELKSLAEDAGVVETRALKLAHVVSVPV